MDRVKLVRRSLASRQTPFIPDSPVALSHDPIFRINPMTDLSRRMLEPSDVHFEQIPISAL